MSVPDVAIVGAGPAGLIAAETVAAAGFSVTVYERMPSGARKFLMAGRGGLNLTHSESLETFLTRYGAAPPLLRDAVTAFPPQALREWAHGLKQETFIGTSGRVFPKAFKASPLLRAWLARLDHLGVRFALRHQWLGWNEEGALRFATPDGEHCVAPRASVLALGGASWPRLGANGDWRDILSAQGIAVTELEPANCGFRIDWSASFRDRFEGQPLKNVALACKGQTSRGEIVITRDGIEGGASMPCRGLCARRHGRKATPSSRSICGRTCLSRSWLRGSRAHAASSRSRPSCARCWRCRPLRSACCMRLHSIVARGLPRWHRTN
ncbi:putative flavoprotein [Afipia carboxidovorans OM4]|nr:putative flavoprotein [Afipia carboxidovorans OM4]